MPVEDLEWITVEDSSAPGQVRRAAIALAKQLGFSEHRAGEVGIAASELATNLHRHAQQGTVLVRVRRSLEESAVELVVADAGPGIEDFALLAHDGRSSGGTLGIGIGAAMRLATWFDSHSVRGRGTVIVATFWQGEAPVLKSGIAALTRPMRGEMVCGDAWAERTNGETTTLLLADGLGHGELAAVAAREAVRAFGSASESEGPTQTLRRLNTQLRPTRGAAIAVVQLNSRAATVTFAGVGNIAAWVDNGERRQGFLCSPGIVGGNPGNIREVEGVLDPHALVVLHSDGLSSKWSLDSYPGLRARDPHLVAATLIRDAGIRHDDASVVVARAP